MAPTPSVRIHNDILLYIFSYLSIPDLARCASVCKQWHKIVVGFTHLWKGKKYVTNGSPTESAETRAILNVLPPLEKVVIKRHFEFAVNISYPLMVLTLSNVSDLGAMKDCQKLRCTYLSTKLDITEHALSSDSPVDLAALRKLQIDSGEPICRPNTAGECAVGTALKLCPNLRELSIRIKYLKHLWADYLDAAEGIGRLRVLEIRCPYLEELSFLRHCSATLQVLEMVGCCEVPSTAFAELRRLENLQRLLLCDCCARDDDLEIGARGLRSLTSLQLVDCELVSDLSFLRHCGQLRELHYESESTPVAGLRHLPDGVRSLCAVGDVVTADELSEALARLPMLEELDLRSAVLERLGFLRHCPQLRSLCLQFSAWYDESELSNLCHLERLESLNLRGCGVDADIISGAFPSLPRLGSLSLAHAEGVAHLQFLRHCPQLRTLSLFGVCGLELEAYRELSHLRNLELLCLSVRVYSYVQEILQPCLLLLNFVSVAHNVCFKREQLNLINCVQCTVNDCQQGCPPPGSSLIKPRKKVAK